MRASSRRLLLSEQAASWGFGRRAHSPAVSTAFGRRLKAVARLWPPSPTPLKQGVNERAVNTAVRQRCLPAQKLRCAPLEPCGRSHLMLDLSVTRNTYRLPLRLDHARRQKLPDAAASHQRRPTPGKLKHHLPEPEDGSQGNHNRRSPPGLRTVHPRDLLGLESSAVRCRSQKLASS